MVAFLSFMVFGSVVFVGCAAPSSALREAPSGGAPVATMKRIGEGRVARLVVNAPMRLPVFRKQPQSEPALGPVIGFLRRGARVEVADLQSSEVLVTPGFPAAPRFGVLRKEPWSSFAVVVDARISPSQIPAEVATGNAAPADVLYGLFREISATRDGLGFAMVRCGRVRVLERDGARMRIAAEYDNGELHGWIDTARADEHDSGCEQPESLAPLPHGYEQAFLRTVGFEWLRDEHPDFFVRVHSAPPRCEHWRIEGGPAPTLRLVGEPDGSSAERAYHIVRGQLGLDPPLLQPRGISIGSVDGYAMVDVVRADHYVSVIETGPPSANDSEILAYRSDAVERWYLDEQSCLAAKDLARPSRGASSFLRQRSH